MTYIIQKKLRYLENAGRLNETKNVKPQTLPI